MTEKGGPGDGRRSVQERLHDLVPGFGKRVETAVGTFDSIEAAATAIGLGHNQLRRIMAEGSVPAFPAIALLARKSGYRLEWLAFNELPEKSSVDVPAFPQLPIGTADEFLWVPEYEARAAAGRGVINEEFPEVKAMFPLPRKMIDQMGLDPARLRILQSDGNSMEPDIRNGDHMVIYIGEDTLIDGAIYVLNTDNGTMVKEVQLDPRGGLKLISKNPSYAPLPVSADEREQLSFAGRLVMTLKRFA